MTVMTAWQTWMQEHYTEFPVRKALFAATHAQFPDVTTKQAMMFFYRHIMPHHAEARMSHTGPRKSETPTHVSPKSSGNPSPSSPLPDRGALEALHQEVQALYGEIESRLQRMLTITSEAMEASQAYHQQRQVMETEYATLQKVVDRYTEALSVHREMVATVDKFGQVVRIDKR